MSLWWLQGPGPWRPKTRSTLITTSGHRNSTCIIVTPGPRGGQEGGAKGTVHSRNDDSLVSKSRAEKLENIRGARCGGIIDSGHAGSLLRCISKDTGRCQQPH